MGTRAAAGAPGTLAPLFAGVGAAVRSRPSDCSGPLKLIGILDDRRRAIVLTLVEIDSRPGRIGPSSFPIGASAIRGATARHQIGTCDLA